MNLKKINSVQAVVLEGTISIISAEATIKNLSSIASAANSKLVLLNAKSIACLEQVFFALEQALDAFENGKPFSRKIELELMIRLMGTTKIDTALDSLELSKGENEILLLGFSKKGASKAVLAAAKSLGIKERKGLLEKNLAKMVGKKGMEQARKQALERVAMTGVM